MATVVFFHAHPDDEATSTGGTMAKLAEAGHRVICVTATKGELGEAPEGMVPAGETLADVRTRELHAACSVLGVTEGRFLGYKDSGMADTDANADPECFWQADVDEAAARLAGWLIEWSADAVVAYDERGNYGHPDHIQVHRVGLRAAELAGVDRVFQATINRDHIIEMMKAAMEAGISISEVEGQEDRLPPTPDELNLGMPASVITTAIDVTAQLAKKRAALACHRSQVSDSSFFLAMPDETFAAAFGTEWFIRVGGDPAQREDALV